MTRINDPATIFEISGSVLRSSALSRSYSSSSSAIPNCWRRWGEILLLLLFFLAHNVVLAFEVTALVVVWEYALLQCGDRINESTNGVMSSNQAIIQDVTQRSTLVMFAVGINSNCWIVVLWRFLKNWMKREFRWHAAVTAPIYSVLQYSTPSTTGSSPSAAYNTATFVWYL